MTIKLFKDVLSYRFTQPIPLSDIDALSEALASKAARRPANQELTTLGFIEPLGVEGEFVEPLPNRSLFISMLKHERLLPSKVVKQSVDAKVREIEEDQMRKVYAKEKARIKDEVVQALLPRAFVAHSRLNALIAPPYIFVETTSAKKADELLSSLREVLGSLPVRPVATKVSPIVSFTDWVARGDLSAPAGFALGESFQSRGASEESSTLSGKNVDLGEEDIVQLIEAGRRVNQLELIWAPESGPGRTGVPFTVNEMLAIKGVQWPEELHQQIRDDVGADPDKVTEARASLLLIGEQFKELLAALLDALDGEEVPQDANDFEQPSDADDEEELV